jgi:esterase/lipase superfamily enzyme
MIQSLARTVCMSLVGFLLVGFPAGLVACSKAHMLPRTPTLYAGLESTPLDEVAPAFQTPEIEILYATDRTRADKEDGSVRYGAGRSRSMVFGRCVIGIGEDLTWEEVVEESLDPRRSTGVPVEILSREEIVRFPSATAPLKVVDGGASELPETIEALDRAKAEMRAVLAERLEASERKEVFLYVHGIQNGFDDAVFTMAQMWHMMGRSGVPVVYTWPAEPALGPLRGYTHDRESGEFTVFHLRQVLRIIAETPNLEKLHVLAHSRGTDVFTTALREVHLQMGGRWKETRERLKFGNLILAAPDMDLEVASLRLRPDMVTMVPERLTMYVSEHDKAIGIAEWLFVSAARLGRVRGDQLTEQQSDNLNNGMIDVVDAKITKPGPYGHSYFVNNPEVLSDVIMIIRDDREIGTEHGRPLEQNESGMWVLRDGYPYLKDTGRSLRRSSSSGHVPRGAAGTR